MRKIGFVLVGLVACGGGGAQPTTAQNGPASAPAADRGQAYALVIDATSCWMGGLWADALGEKSDLRDEGISTRCKKVMHAIDALPDFEKPLRAIDATAVERLSHKIDAVAKDDAIDKAHPAEIVALFTHVADATRETMHARLAADQVKDDASATQTPDSYRADKNAAGPVVSQSSALQALLADRGPYADDAHAIGLLVALDRMEIAHGLPKHLKIDAVSGAYQGVFGVSAPAVSGAPADKAQPGVWLAYVTRVAAAAQHAVPDSLSALPDRETYAWSAVLAGFADKMRAEPAFAAQSPLGDVTRKIVARLDDGFATTKSLMAAKH